MSSTPIVRNARNEAQSLAGTDYAVAVLEPSPPTVAEGPFFADDPVAPVPTDATRTVVPAGMAGDLDWDALAGENPALADFVTAHWLGGARQLPPVPADLSVTRVDLHRLAAYVIAPVRHKANGKFGLRWTKGGFGTPFFGDDRQIRVEGTNLVDQRGDQVRVTPIGSLQAATEFLESKISAESGAESDSPEVGDINTDLNVDEAASRFLGDWYGMAFAALELLRADEGSVNPARPQLWPGHFDPATEVGDEDHRASYGASPGDGGIDEPYLYVSVWWPDKIGVDADDPFWNAPSFTGAVLRLADFPQDQDPVVTAANFWRDVRDRLSAGQS